MVIIRNIVNDFSDDEDIELCCDDDEDLEFGSSEVTNITYGTPSSFFVTIDSAAGQDIQNRSNNFNNDFDSELFIDMQFESNDATINAIKQFHIKNSVDYIVVESRPDRYAGQLLEDPDIPIKPLVKEIVTRFGYTVTYRKAWTAKQIAMSQIYGDWEGSYKELPRWFNNVQCYAPGTVK
ncbi:hypothetical protein Lal_00007459 [Lupinus albus]|nr:hypothetical protein Lal_00007459 [Lupinus albus]